MRLKRRGIAAGTTVATAMSSNNNLALAAASASTINAIIFGFAVVLAIGPARAESSIRSCVGGTSDRTAADGHARFAVCRHSRTFSTWRR
jgi:hypothetical protein